MKNRLIIQNVVEKQQMDQYFKKLKEISLILQETEKEIYYKFSELLRGKDVEKDAMEMASHKRYVQTHLINKPNKQNAFVIDYLYILKVTIAETGNPAISYFKKCK